VSEQVIPIDLKYRPEAAVSDGLLLQSEKAGVLIFNAVKQGPDGYWDTAGTGILEFSQLATTKFRSINDAALPGHPLYRLGLDEVDGMGEVKESRWIAEEERISRVKFPNTSYNGLRHFVVILHDALFECIAENFEMIISEKPREEVIRAYLAIIYP
jgi:hypothetical protein